ncbi:MAG: ABC transporter ATP-binding protein [Bacillota bacterium]
MKNIEPYLHIKNLKINFRHIGGLKNILDIDEIKVEKGESFGIIGESGTGKTVLALSILGLLEMPPGEIERGEIFLDGFNVVGASSNELRRKVRGKKAVMIFQDPMSTLNPVLTVGEQLKQVIIKNQGLRGRLARAKAMEMLELVRLSDPGSVLGKYPHELSGGQRQRVIIALALSCGAEFIIADEPTRNLDVTIQAGILVLLKELQRDLNVTLLFIANNLGLVSATCDRVAIFNKGRIVEQGETSAVISNPSSPYTRMLIEAIPRRREERGVSAEKTAGGKRSGENRLDPAGDPSAQEAAARTGTNGPVLEVKGLVKHFPVRQDLGSRKMQFVRALDGVSLKVESGETLGLVGESGCGKTTLANTMLRLSEPTGGRVVFDGKDIFSLGRKELRAVRRDMQIVFQDPFWSLNPRMLVKDIIGEPLEVQTGFNELERIKKVEKLLEMVDLPAESVYKYVHEFSGGQRQRIAIARALSLMPKLIVLDEPTSAIDIVSQIQILELLDNLKRDLDLTYVVISHDLSVISYMSDKIAVMYLGKIAEYGDVRRIFREPGHPYTQVLFAAIPDINTKDISEIKTVRGSVPSAIEPPAGCRFHPRCAIAVERCSQEEPELRETDDGRLIACHLWDSRGGSRLPL